jgi:RimJ/RimL family protein N-acetyltransferase
VEDQTAVEACKALEVFGRTFAGPCGLKPSRLDHLASGGALAVIDAPTGSLIGASRFDNLDEERSEVEIGWTFLTRAYWGGRHNAGLKRLMLGHAFRSVETVVFLVARENYRSRRSIEKLGANQAGTRREMILYELQRTGYRNRSHR